MKKSLEKKFDEEFGGHIFCSSHKYMPEDLKAFIDEHFVEKEGSFPMLTDNWKAVKYDFGEGRKHVAVVRKDDTKEELEWVAKFVLDSCIESKKGLYTKEQVLELIGELKAEHSDFHTADIITTNTTGMKMERNKGYNQAKKEIRDKLK